MLSSRIAPRAVAGSTDPTGGTAADADPLLAEALAAAAEAGGFQEARLLEAGEGESVTNGAPLGVDSVWLVLSGGRPRELGLVDCAARLVRQAWTWGAVAYGRGRGRGSAAGRVRRANFVAWLAEKVRAAAGEGGDGGELALLLLELEERDPVARMYGADEAEEGVPLLYNAVERAVRGVDSVYRCDDAALACVLPRCDRANAGKVAARVRAALAEFSAGSRRGASLEATLRIYAYPDDLAVFASGVRAEDVALGDPAALAAAWTGFLAGALRGSAVAFAADERGRLAPVAAVGRELPAGATSAVEEGFRSGAPAVLPRAGAGERSALLLPALADGVPAGVVLVESVRGSFGPAETEVGRRAAARMGVHLRALGGAARGAPAVAVGPVPRRYRHSYDGIIGTSPAMHAVFELLERVIETDYPVIVHGESGTGKELIARAVHFNGARREKPLIAENCAALNENLLEAELFGYEKGSFTGAETSRKGLFELADGGTLFLDEVADMKSGMQKDLLRILQEGIVRPVGSKKFLHVDVRIICASNRNLAQLVDEGKFRADLYYRLNVWAIQMPALRERREDVPLLVEHFLAKIAQQTGTPAKRAGRGVLEALAAYDWPGNIRELRNEVARMVALSSGEELQLRDFSKRPSGDAARPQHLERVDEILPLAEMEKLHVLRALRFTNGNRARAADLLGINKATIYRKLKSYGLEE